MKKIRKDQLDYIRSFAIKLFNDAGVRLGRRVIDLAEDVKEGEGIFTDDQWSKKIEFILDNELEVSVIITARRADK